MLPLMPYLVYAVNITHGLLSSNYHDHACPWVYLVTTYVGFSSLLVSLLALIYNYNVRVLSCSSIFRSYIAMSSESESQKASEPSDPDSQSASVQFVSVDGVVKKTNPRRKPSGGSVNLNELETVSLPDDPTANDIYSLSPGSNYQPLPSLVPNQFEDSSLFVDVNNPHLSVSDSDHTSTCDRKTKKKTCASLKGKPCGKPPCKFCHLLNESIADMENLSSSSLDAENGNRSADIATIVESNYFNANFTKDKEDHIDPTSPPKTPNFNNFHNFHCPEFVRPGTSSSDHLSVNSDSHDTSTASSDKSFSIIQEDFLDDYDIAMRLQQCERNIVDKNLKDEKNRGTSSATVSLQPEQDDAYLSRECCRLFKLN